MSPVYSKGSTLFLNEALVLANITEIEKAVRLLFSESPSDRWQVNLDGLEHLDTAGALFLHQLTALADQYESSLSLGPLPEDLQSIFDFATPLPNAIASTATLALSGALGAAILRLNQRADFLYLMADLSYFSVQAVESTRYSPRCLCRSGLCHRAQALPIIGLICF